MMVQGAQKLLTIRDRPLWLFLLKMLEIDRFVRITILHPTTDLKTIYGSVQAMCGRLMLVTIWKKKKNSLNDEFFLVSIQLRVVGTMPQLR